MRVYRKLFGKYVPPRCEVERDRDQASEMIYNLLASGEPRMIARYGSNELSCVCNYIGIQEHHSWWRFIRWRGFYNRWNERVASAMSSNAGFFPSTPAMLERFSKLIIEDTKQLDLLASWVPDEYYVRKFMPQGIPFIHLLLLEPYWGSNPWSRVLNGKNVLVIHPFVETIKRQYEEKRHLLFENKDVLPDFNLLTIKAIQTIGGG